MDLTHDVVFRHSLLCWAQVVWYFVPTSLLRWAQVVWYLVPTSLLRWAQVVVFRPYQFIVLHITQYFNPYT